jgi:hypothetical protein
MLKGKQEPHLIYEIEYATDAESLSQAQAAQLSQPQTARI